MNSITRFYERHRLKLWLVQVVVLLGVGLLVGISMRSESMSSGSAGHGAHGNHSANASEKEAELWTCSMHPQIRRDGPGKCPICGMDLVPVKKSVGGVRTISISSDVKKLMNVQTVPVTHRYVTAKCGWWAKIDYDETRLAHVTAWVSGRLDRLFVDFTGVQVNKGDHMVSIYSEELYIGAGRADCLQCNRQRERPDIAFLRAD